MRWSASAFAGICASMLAAASLPVLVGCGSDSGGGAPSPEPPRPSLASPEPAMPVASPEQAKPYEQQVGAVHPPPPAQAPAHSRGANGGPPPEAAAAPRGPKPPHGSAARIRLHLARHDLYQPWYPMVGEVTVVRSKVAVIGTSLAAGAAGASREICEAVVNSDLVAAAVVLYGREETHVCR